MDSPHCKIVSAFGIRVGLPNICGLWCTYEIMTPDGGVAANIRTGRFEQLNNDIDSGGQYGMVKLNKTLVRLVREGRITKDDALGASYEPQTLKRAPPTPREALRSSRSWWRSRS